MCAFIWCVGLTLVVSSQPTICSSSASTIDGLEANPKFFTATTRESYNCYLMSNQNPTTTTSTTVYHMWGIPQRPSDESWPLIYVGIRTTFWPTNTLRQLLIHPKGPVPKLDRSGVIYRVPCKNCPQVSMIFDHYHYCMCMIFLWHVLHFFRISNFHWTLVPIKLYCMILFISLTFNFILCIFFSLLGATK